MGQIDSRIQKNRVNTKPPGVLHPAAYCKLWYIHPRVPFSSPLYNGTEGSCSATDFDEKQKGRSAGIRRPGQTK